MIARRLRTMPRKSKDDVIRAIRLASEAGGGNPLTQRQFFASSDIRISDVLRYFPKWSDACHAANAQHDRSRDRIPDGELLADWGEVARRLGRIPSLTEYKVNGRFSRNVFDRFGLWRDVPSAFAKHFAGRREWKDVLPLAAEPRDANPKRQKRPRPTASLKEAQPWHGKLDNRPVYGDPIDFRGLRHEPVNEQGVVFLFGMVARELGYLVEAIQGGFPDCEAKRQVARGQWQPVRIEFEYASRSFLDHGHDPKKCDVVICWIDNWPDCPDHLEVLALSDVISKL